MPAQTQSLLLFDWDETYRSQHFYERFPCRWMPRPAAEGLGIYCEQPAALKLERALAAGPVSRVRFFGSGDFHYLTLLLASGVRQDFELLLLDHHSDMLRPALGPLLSCGNWLRVALGALPRLRRAILVGARENDLSGLPAGKTAVSLPAPTPESLARALEGPPLPLCVSVDKDVLAPEAAVTNWDQGGMTLPELAALLRTAARLRPLLSLDVCGEFPERFGTLAAFRRASLRNDRANAFLLALWLQTAPGLCARPAG